MFNPFLDTTLRDGEQQPGVSFTRQDKIDLARGLAAWGVGILEVGIPAMGRAERQTLDVLHGLDLGVELLVWNRLSDSDLDLCLEAGWPALHVSVPVSDILLKGKLGRDRAWVLNQIDRVVGRAAEAGRSVSFGAEDASRADFGFLCQVYDRAVAAGAGRLRYADTLGILTPSAVTRVIGPLAASAGAPIDFHGHNDFGLATANTLAAYEAGAQVLSCSLLGLGERAGNAALEEVAAAMVFLGDPEMAPERGRFADLTALCRDAARRAGVTVPSRKPLVGSGVFEHESGIHVDGLLKCASTYEAWPPETFGGKRRLVFGKHSGLAALRHWASSRGMILEDGQAREFLESLRDTMAERPGIDPSAVLEGLATRHGGSP